MLKMFAKILRLGVLFVVSAALIGVNIAQLSCICCDSSSLQVELLPQEKTCQCGKQEPCRSDEGCTQDQENSRHDFYQVAGFSQLVKSALPDIEFFNPNREIFYCFTRIPEIKDCCFLCPEIIPDLPPSPELLCTYRC